MEISKKFGLRIICLLVCALCLLTLVLPASAATPAPNTLHNLAATVYHSASVDALVIGHIRDGEPVTVQSSEGNFYKLDCYGMTGFIPKDQIRYSLEDGYYVSCNLTRSDTHLLNLQSAKAVWMIQQSVMDFSHDLLGVPYVYGGQSPWGFDCSGFVSYVYENHGFSIHRCADDQMQDGMIMAREDLQPGDLVFFSVYGSWLASHVGIYIGGGQMIHASSSRGIRIDSIDRGYWSNYYVGARRLTAADIRITEPLDTDNSDIPIIAKTGRVNVLFFHIKTDWGSRWAGGTNCPPRQPFGAQPFRQPGTGHWGRTGRHTPYTPARSHLPGRLPAER